ncbi:hypothetical protein [Pseudonocardia xinjiangensis]|uniref:Cell wall binding repeat protein n=1 Tax=Pseudonocardia xinjiangensis TaxID=75289 RepID=A0ABX1RJ29_9PSEU|nr:hypothetical protein [Pseudonocardia xinjiangensis]NMH80372.1 hypothetical protein [Pseudonocardia xinjiangensis]
MVVLVAVLLIGACTAPAPPVPLSPQVTAPGAPTTVLPSDDPVELAVATSAALYATAPVVVLTAAGDEAGQAPATAVAERIGAPLLLTPADGDAAGVRAELSRLGARTVLAVDDGAAHWASAADGSAEIVTDEAALPAVTAPPRRQSVLVLAQDSPAQAAATATARASGAEVVVVPGADPRRAPEPPRRPEHVLALGSAFGTSDVLDRRLAVAATGVQLPGGGQVLFPGRRMVALYGHPGAPALGVLGEQGVEESVKRAQSLAAEYQPLLGEPVVPAFEVITTVADSGPGPDGDYSSESSVADLRPWVDAARGAGVYVVLDLQPGRSDFLTQARRYEELLAQPHVGLALDPEWRLAPQQRHRTQIGSVGVDEINSVITWLADLTRDRVLPQKLLMVHQFRLSMISGREKLDTSRDELGVILHADGFGTPDLKLQTWATLHEAQPSGVHWGWKNFYDEDRPMFTPAQTMAVGPEAPVFVSFQ